MDEQNATPAAEETVDAQTAVDESLPEPVVVTTNHHEGSEATLNIVEHDQKDVAANLKEQMADSEDADADPGDGVDDPKARTAARTANAGKPSAAQAPVVEGETPEPDDGTMTPDIMIDKETKVRVVPGTSVTVTDDYGNETSARVAGSHKKLVVLNTVGGQKRVKPSDIGCMWVSGDKWREIQAALKARKNGGDQEAA